jgi:hypothetical protein
MKDGVGRDVSSQLVVTIYFHRFLDNNIKSARTCLIHVSSLDVDVIARYSTSVLDCAIRPCFLFFHVTKFPPKNVQKSIIDFLSMLRSSMYFI